MAHKKKIQATPAPTIAPRLLVARDAATYLGIGVFALRGLHWAGKLRGIMLGRRMLWDKAVLDKYVDGLVKASA